MQNITILSGGGSPHCDEYRPVYELLVASAEERSIQSKVIDYVGAGQFPEYGSGLSLPNALQKITPEIRTNTPSTLLCRSFGCFVAAYLLAFKPENMANYSRVIFWGPSAHHVMWEHTAQTATTLKKFNEEAERKGVQLSDDFWSTFIPIEFCAKRFSGIRVSIGFGSEDKYCDAAFAMYLKEVVSTYTTCVADMKPIMGARHEIKPTDKPEIIREYLKFIFDE